MTMDEPGPDDKVYPTVKLATTLKALAAEGVSSNDALNGVHVSETALASPATRVSLDQIIAFYRNASRLTRNPQFAFQTGLSFHVSTYGMYGFAILSSINFRQTMRFAIAYHRLAAPTTEISFSEQDGRAVWSVAPVPHPLVDAPLYKFLVELQFGAHVALHRDTMGPSFVPKELRMTYRQPHDAPNYAQTCKCDMVFNSPENQFVFDAEWIDRTPEFGNEVTYASLQQLCAGLLDELQFHLGVAGKVREILLVNLAQPTSFEAAARHLAMTPRTLRRRLSDEHTSYRRLIDELRMHVAVKYLRDTELTTEEIADLLGFSDAANFRQAFRRWTGKAPQTFRRGISEVHKS